MIHRLPYAILAPLVKMTFVQQKKYNSPKKSFVQGGKNVWTDSKSRISSKCGIDYCIDLHLLRAQRGRCRVGDLCWVMGSNIDSIFSRN